METILHTILNEIVNYAILLFEYVGVIVIIIACLHGIYFFRFHRKCQEQLKLQQ